MAKQNKSKKTKPKISKPQMKPKIVPKARKSAPGNFDTLLKMAFNEFSKKKVQKKKDR